MNTNEERLYDIVNGPNKDTLFDACKYAYVKGAQIPINFDIAAGYTMPKSDPNCAYIPLSTRDFKIASIENEDGSGESFNLEGYCTAGFKRRPTGLDIYDTYRFSAYYNTKRRTGTIKFHK